MASLTRGQSKKYTTPNTALRGHFTMLVALPMEDTGGFSRLLFILPLQRSSSSMRLRLPRVQVLEQTLRSGL